uniref:Glucose-6-phosphate 1-dehydrogenase n=1 Tax=Rhizopus delemar TaxID=936053 RepID=T2A5Q5_9FUNG|nr:glucose-6-phosphate dehydrogenase [Rhizopus delemar]
MSHESYLQRITQYIKVQDLQHLEAFKKMTFYVAGQYDDDESFRKLSEAIEQCESKHRVYYIALPPSVFIPVAQGLKRNVYTTKGSNRLVVEKPFGMDSETSDHLRRALGALFTENEVKLKGIFPNLNSSNKLDLPYRSFPRSRNGKEYHEPSFCSCLTCSCLEPYLYRECTNHIQRAIWNCRTWWLFCSVWYHSRCHAEPEVSFSFYCIKILILQIHLLQVLTLIAMERPISTDAEAIRDEKVKVLKCISPIRIEDTLLGQYVAVNGKPGYLEDETLKNYDSLTPTFAAAVCFVNNERWEGVPFILKAGKALNEAKVEVRLQFHRVAGSLFSQSPRNELVLRIQPKEAVYVKFNNKQPGLSYQTIQTDLNLSYDTRYTDLSIPDAYESLILDVLRNDHSNFVRNDELQAAWKIFTPLLHKIDKHDSGVDIKPYAYGSRGPKELDDFIKKYGYHRDSSGYWPLQNVNASSNKL